MMLGLTAAVASAAAVAVLVWGFTEPVGIAAQESDAGRYLRKATTAPADRADGPEARRTGLSITELQSLCGIDLHRPLYDAPKPKTVASATAARTVPLSIRLIGTAVEPGHSAVILQMKDGSIELCAEGRTIDCPGGAVAVTKIEHRKASVRFGGRTYVLEIRDDQQ